MIHCDQSSLTFAQATVESSGDEADVKPSKTVSKKELQSPKKSPSKEKPLSKHKVSCFSVAAMFPLNCYVLLVDHQSKCGADGRRIQSRSKFYYLRETSTS